MIIQLENTISPQNLDLLKREITNVKYSVNQVSTQMGNYLVCIGKDEFDIRSIGHLSGVKDIHRVNEIVKLVSRKWKTERTQIDLGDGVKVGDKNFAIMAGPCSIEGEEQIRSTVKQLVKSGVRIMRGGVYKPRSSPYSFRGMGMDGLKLFSQLCKAEGIKIITEVMQVSQVEEMHDYVDIFQVGSRNSQNFNLLDALGGIDKPVLIKRGISGSIDELLYSAEYIFSGGNEKLMLCERGIRTYERAYRNTLDLNAVPILKEKSHLPVIVDPSHGIGLRQHMEPMALAATVAGADGLLLEIHEQPEIAFSDGQQTLNYREFEQLLEKIKIIKEVL
ncbi:phospho-2-dehydro-3-deoxyheptonate aldolase [Owenweeksia hongkongensis DSM 17368]|uniref:Phospho-2-dehydro-3-deoxyheptonate aldolase n=1 Tax=Owenweeksia hongkongensis (strain DSM 17368 / CIP 108786 / JCM 12287 / NRRL B-23963 / UST20020801) TaxID=926562 RepID=G8R332_OWEHD|nr:bifunctional 3-deoxy-7-phosphoheptulonate synthase/chorismate mutase [Owenweeksia hongkongensis]AEV34057.1 phospho-2-dehydro-3-deoxyheptonate aldolase [Owenweeksia hongkongensis DSM 17368]